MLFHKIKGHHVQFEGAAGDDSVWVAWWFTSIHYPKEPVPVGTGTGAWLDNLQAWQYIPPAQPCVSDNPGSKGIVLPAYEKVGATAVPIIRHGDMQALDKIIQSKPDWVRLGFVAEPGNVIDYLDYDLMIDALCTNGIGVLGLVNQETMDLMDYNDDTNAPLYREAFKARVAEIVDHYRNRITYWEVWNEENLSIEAGGAYLT